MGAHSESPKCSLPRGGSPPEHQNRTVGSTLSTDRSSPRACAENQSSRFRAFRFARDVLALDGEQRPISERNSKVRTAFFVETLAIGNARDLGQGTAQMFLCDPASNGHLEASRASN